MKLIMFVAAGGAVGAVARFLVNEAFAARGLTLFPWATLTVNVAGCFLMGIVYVLINERLGGSPEWRALLATGFLGGLTTFSAFSLDALNLMTGSGGLRTGIYVAVSVALSMGALVAGIGLARLGLTS